MTSAGASVVFRRAASTSRGYSTLAVHLHRGASQLSCRLAPHDTYLEQCGPDSLKPDRRGSCGLPKDYRRPALLFGGVSSPLLVHRTGLQLAGRFPVHRRKKSAPCGGTEASCAEQGGIGPGSKHLAAMRCHAQGAEFCRSALVKGVQRCGRILAPGRNVGLTPQ